MLPHLQAKPAIHPPCIAQRQTRTVDHRSSSSRCGFLDGLRKPSSVDLQTSSAKRATAGNPASRPNIAVPCCAALQGVNRRYVSSSRHKNLSQNCHSHLGRPSRNDLPTGSGAALSPCDGNSAARRLPANAPAVLLNRTGSRPSTTPSTEAIQQTFVHRLRIASPLHPPPRAENRVQSRPFRHPGHSQNRQSCPARPPRSCPDPCQPLPQPTPHLPSATPWG